MQAVPVFEQPHEAKKADKETPQKNQCITCNALQKLTMSQVRERRVSPA
jgi:hypothetical protein